MYHRADSGVKPPTIPIHVCPPFEVVRLIVGAMLSGFEQPGGMDADEGEDAPGAQLCGCTGRAA